MRQGSAARPTQFIFVLGVIFVPQSRQCCPHLGMDYLWFSFQLLSDIVSSCPIGDPWESERLIILVFHKALSTFQKAPFCPTVEAMLAPFVDGLSSESPVVMHESRRCVGDGGLGRPITHGSLEFFSIEMLLTFKTDHAVILLLVSTQHGRWLEQWTMRYHTGGRCDDASKRNQVRCGLYRGFPLPHIRVQSNRAGHLIVFRRCCGSVKMFHLVKSSNGQREQRTRSPDWSWQSQNLDLKTSFFHSGKMNKVTWLFSKSVFQPSNR
jgi:hypothetical protein